jgi:hypothetical protein
MRTTTRTRTKPSDRRGGARAAGRTGRPLTTADDDADETR